jgi:hypothetical protein
MDAKELLALCDRIDNAEPHCFADARTLAAWVREQVESLPGEIDSVIDGLFRDCWGQDVKRLALTNDDGKDLGGWCKDAVKKQFRKALDLKEPT